MSRDEQLIEAILNGEEVDIEPLSRSEAYLKNCCNKCGCEGLPTPVSRMDALLYRLAEVMAGGGDYKFDTGSFTPSATAHCPQIEDETQYDPGEIKHNLGVIPSVVYIWTNDDELANTHIKMGIVQNFGEVYDEDPDYPERSWYYSPFEIGAIRTPKGTFAAVPASPIFSIYANKETFVLPNDAARSYANVKYNWIAIDLGLTKPSNDTLILT